MNPTKLNCHYSFGLSVHPNCLVDSKNPQFGINYVGWCFFVHPYWTHLDSVKFWNVFYMVLIFNFTYKINKYRLQLLEIIGVTSIELMLSFEFAYLKHEMEDNFIWTSEKVNELFTSEKLFFKIMVTNREFSLIDLIEVVFPTSIYLFYVVFLM